MSQYKETKRASKVAVIASGLSLVDVDLSQLRNDGYFICVNDAWRRFHNTDAVVTIDTVRLDQRFGDCPHKIIVGTPENFGNRFAKMECDKVFPKREIFYMQRLIEPGLSEDPTVLHSGENSGFAALNLAFHMRPKWIFLFGIDLVDMGRHWHDHSDPRPCPLEVQERLPNNFALAAPQLARNNIQVINASPDSRVGCFRRMSPQEAIRSWNFIGSEHA